MARIPVGHLHERVKTMKERPSRVVIPLGESVSGGAWEATEDQTGAIEVVHTVSPELAARLDGTKGALTSVGSAVKWGLILMAVVIALAIAAALLYATYVASKVQRRRRSTRSLHQKIAAAKER